MAIESILTKFTRVMTHQAGLNVVQSGDIIAKTDGQTVWIPFFSDAKLEKLNKELESVDIKAEKLMFGLTEHESAHCTTTFGGGKGRIAEVNKKLDATVNKMASRMFIKFPKLPSRAVRQMTKSVLHQISNFCEDRRIENKWVERFPGSREYFAEISRFDAYITKKGIWSGGETGLTKPSKEEEALFKPLTRVYETLFQKVTSPWHEPNYAGLHAGDPEAVKFVEKHFDYNEIINLPNVEKVIDYVSEPTEIILEEVLRSIVPPPPEAPKEEEKGKGGKGGQGDGEGEGDEMDAEAGEGEGEGEEESDEEGAKGTKDGGDGEGEEEGDEMDAEEEGGVKGDFDPVDSATPSDPSGGDSSSDGSPGMCNPDEKKLIVFIGAVDKLEEMLGDPSKASFRELAKMCTKVERDLKYDKNVDPVKAWEPLTTEHDTVQPVPPRIAPADYDRFRKELESITMGAIGRKLLGEYRGRHVAGPEGTKINLRAVAGLAAGVLDLNIMFLRKEARKSRKNVCVQLVIDCSGSMSGTRIRLAMQSAAAMADLLHRLSIPFEVIGFTTSYSTRGWGTRVSYKEHGWTRTEPLLFPLFKGFNETHLNGMKAMAASVNYCGNNNVDGECVLFCANRLLARRERRKIQIVLSDGYPAFAGSDDAKATKHLKAVAHRLEVLPGFELYGIGIQSDAVKDFYKHWVKLDQLQELPKVLGRLLSGHTEEFTTTHKEGAA